MAIPCYSDDYFRRMTTPPNQPTLILYLQQLPTTRTTTNIDDKRHHAIFQDSGQGAEKDGDEKAPQLFTQKLIIHQTSYEQ